MGARLPTALDSVAAIRPVGSELQPESVATRFRASPDSPRVDVLNAFPRAGATEAESIADAAREPEPTPAAQPVASAPPRTATRANPVAQPAEAPDAATRTGQELAGLRQAADTLSQRVTPNTNAQRADVVGARLSQDTATTVPATGGPAAPRAVADAVDSAERERLSLNRAALQTLRGGFEAAQESVPSIDEQREEIRAALSERRSAQPVAETEARREADAARGNQGALFPEDAAGPRILREDYPDAVLSFFQTPGAGRLNFLA